jgi:four helix bundle protein
LEQTIARLAGGRSKAEFVAKLGISEEEADESGYWMEVIIEGELLKPKQVEPLLNEANELTRIFAQSRISASRALARTLKRHPSNRQSAIRNRQ